MTLTLTVDELRALVGPNADPAAVNSILMKLDALNGTVGSLSGDLNVLTGQVDRENTTLATTDDQIATIGADVQKIVTLYGALKTDDENEAVQLAALQQSLADAQTADGAGSPRAQALQAIVDALTPILTPAAPAPQPVDPTVAPAPVADPTQTAPDGGAASPAPSDGSSAGGDATTPAPATGTGTDASATGPAA